jgi:hypothetical protein
MVLSHLLFTLSLMFQQFEGVPPKEMNQTLEFRLGNLTVIMVVNPVQLVRNGSLIDNGKVISGFTGAVRRIDYRLWLNGSHGNKLQVRETLKVVYESSNGMAPIRVEPARIARVGADGRFEDLMALGTTGSEPLPPDFRQVVRQQLYIFDPKQYPNGCLFAIIEIERHPTDIKLRLVWPGL